MQHHNKEALAKMRERLESEQNQITTAVLAETSRKDIPCDAQMIELLEAIREDIESAKDKLKTIISRT